MSQLVYPSLPGLGFSVYKKPKFKNKVLESVSGTEFRASYQTYPIWDLTLNYEFFRERQAFAEMRTLLGFFLKHGASFDSFLLNDPDDNTAVDQSCGVGTGALTTFQMTRAYGAGGFTFTEPVENVNVVTNVKVNGSVVSSGTYTVGSTGIITFSSGIPGSGQPVTWNGTFYHRCRFLQDEMEMEKFLYHLWKTKKVELRGAPGNRVL